MYSRCVVVISSVSTTKQTARAGNGIWVFGNGGKRKRALYFDLGIKEKEPTWLVSVAVASNGRSLSLLVYLLLLQSYLQWATRLTRRCHEEHNEGRARATPLEPYYEGSCKKSNYSRTPTTDSKFVWALKSSHHTPFWLAQQPGPHPCGRCSSPSGGFLR
jgi:hypothetical protein